MMGTARASVLHQTYFSKPQYVLGERGALIIRYYSEYRWYYSEGSVAVESSESSEYAVLEWNTFRTTETFYPKL